MKVDERGDLRRSARLGGLALLAACAALAVTGCITNYATPRTIIITLPPSSQTPTVAPSTGAPTGTPAGSSAPSATTTIAGATPTVSGTTQVTSAPDGRWKATFRTPVVSGGAPSALTAMNNAIATRVSAYISSFNGTELPVVAGADGPSTLKGDFSVAFASPSLLSLRFTVETYVSGAAHPATEAGSINMNVGSGAVIQFPDLFTSPAAALPVLQAQAHKKLAALLGADLVWPASVTMADFGTAWVFTKAGLELTWSQGAIASMAAGTVTISIGWSAISSVISKPGPAADFVP